MALVRARVCGRTVSAACGADHVRHAAESSPTRHLLEAEATHARERRSSSTEQAPADKHMMVYMIMALLGAGALLPWNVAVSASDYLETAFPNKHIMYYVPMAYTMPQLPVLFLMIAVSAGRAVRTSHAGAALTCCCPPPPRLAAG